MTDQLWAGLDVGDYRTHVCITDDNGVPVLETETDTNPDLVAEILGAFPIARFAKVGMEASLPCSAISRHLRSLGYPAAIYDARRIKRFLSISANKTDINDARGIAQVTRIGRSALREVHVRSEELQRIRSELAMRDSLVRQRVAAEVSLKGRLRAHGIRIGYTKSHRVLRERIEHAMSSLGADGLWLTDHLAPLLSLCGTLRAYVAHLDAALKKDAERIDATRRLMQIPGIGPITSLSFYTVIEDPFRFDRVSDVGAYLGLTPKISQSGKIARHGRISGYGSPLTRGHLVLAARGLLRKSSKVDCDIRTWGLAISERAGSRKAQVAVARKLAIVMLSMWQSDSDFEAFRNLIQFPQGTDPDLATSNRGITL